jgi:hypothetical protein
MKAVILLILLTSCATKTILIGQSQLLPYKEANQLTKLENISKAVDLKIVETKNLSKNLGVGYTGVTYDKTPIQFEGDPQRALSAFFTSALEMRNISLNAASGVKMEIHINELTVNEVIQKFQGEKAGCKVNATFYVEDANTKWSGKFWTEFLSASDLREGTERIAPTLASCLNEVVEKLVKDEKFLNIIK